MKLWYRVMYSVLFLISAIASARNYDLTVVGQIKYAESLPRLALGIIDALHQDLHINFIPTPGEYDLSYIPPAIKNIIHNPDKTPGRVALFVDMLWSIYNTAPVKFLPNSSIKIAYSMLESTGIPTQWVTILNTHFDAVVVPDEFYKTVYAQCGVVIPIFVIPCGMYQKELFNYTPQKKPHMPFVFGMSAAFSPHKNYELVIQAFATTFGNNPRVRLRLHGRGGANYQLIKNLIKSYKVTNIELIATSLSPQQYKQFLLSLDCYVLLSKGEGFSLTPREALALGIPCIVSNNTAQATICATEYVYSVPSLVQEPAYYKCFGGCYGTNFNCTLQDAQEAFMHVYSHYDVYTHKAAQGKKWVEQYLYKNLKKQYLTLIKPAHVVLGEKNSIEEDTLYTNSPELYKKYMYS